MGKITTFCTGSQADGYLITIIRSIQWDVIRAVGFLVAIGGLLIGSILYITGKTKYAKDSIVGSFLLIGAFIIFSQLYRMGGPASLPIFYSK